MTAAAAPRDRTFFLFNAVVSTLALLLLTWLLVLRKGGDGQADLSFLPPVNAGLNTTATIFLLAGFAAIKAGKRELHQYMMVSAFVASALFLVCYLAYHYAHGDTKYTGEGAIRVVYFAVLISHILLSVFILPLALTTFYFTRRDDKSKHKRIAKITLPIWLYVSVTGVVIFAMLRTMPQ